ncbi:MAG: bifunctional riboflavin kinase/FAD synthetase [Thermoleophilia bacterium]|nr:bifunctional riboflavin kinase/FAD synthetase [Thermoleophilia bacterium]
MRVYRELVEVPKGKRVVAIGTFDGVHIGHQRIIGDAVSAAKEQGARSMVMTFHPHPLSVIAPDKCPPILTPLNIKTDLIGTLGVDELLIIPFTDEFSHLSPTVFCEMLFSSNLGATQVIVGDNFRFGYKAGGDIGFLEEYGRKVGMKVVAEPLVTAGEMPISSTRIRNLLIDGNVAEVREILSRPPSTHGKVVHGDKRGRTLGVRTANIDTHVDCIFPGRGVYLADLFIGKDPYACLVNVGQNPTFCSTDGDSMERMRIEAHILDFDRNLYGFNVRVDFLERVRDEKKFDGPSELVAQIKEDIATARRYKGFAASQSRS